MNIETTRLKGTISANILTEDYLSTLTLFNDLSKEAFFCHSVIIN